MNEMTNEEQVRELQVEYNDVKAQLEPLRERAENAERELGEAVKLMELFAKIASMTRVERQTYCAAFPTPFRQASEWLARRVNGETPGQTRDAASPVTQNAQEDAFYGRVEFEANKL